MALLFMDGFDHYNSGVQSSLNCDLFKKWTGGVNWDSNYTVSPIYARQTGNGQGFVNVGGNSARILYKTLPTNYATLIAGMWFRPSVLPGNSAYLYLGDGTTEQISVRGDGVGHLTLSRNGTTLATSTNTLVASTWYHIELKATIHNTTGVYELRVNGTSTGWIPQATGANTRGGTANNYANTLLFCSQGDTGMYFDDIYVLDTSGSVANDFIGPSRIITIYPNSAGNYSAFTPSYAANFANVNETLGDGDQTFNMSSTSGNKDTFGFDDVPAATIYAIQHNIQHRQDAGTARTIRSVQRSSGTDYSGTSRAATGSHTFYVEPVSVNPATSAAYTTSDINAAEFGYENV